MVADEKHEKAIYVHAAKTLDSAWELVERKLAAAHAELAPHAPEWYYSVRTADGRDLDASNCETQAERDAFCQWAYFNGVVDGARLLGRVDAPFDGSSDTRHFVNGYKSNGCKSND